MRFWLVVICTLGLASAQPYQPTEEELRQVRARLAELGAAIERASTPANDVLLPDVEVYRKAAQWILRYPEEFYVKAYLPNTLRVLEEGIRRAKELARGEPSWPRQKGRLVRAYRSRVDGSVQPYGLVIPESYDGRKAVRLDVVLHGRGATLNEVSFIAAHDATHPVTSEQDFIQLEVFGRGNNAYRWAGETDVFEALDSVQKRYRIDPARIVLRGFSMGGAGAWHIGLQHPTPWVAMEAGAGFVETKIYAKLGEIPPYQEAALHIYDALDYSLNAFNLPVVGYGGEDDPQLRASAAIREQLARERFHFTPQGLNFVASDLRSLFLVGPHTGHKFHPDSKKVSDEFIKRAVAKGREEPSRLRFVTWTPRWNRCFWVDVDQLERQYDRAEVYAEHSLGRTTVKTTNVARLKLTVPGRVTLDGRSFSEGPLMFHKVRGQWAVETPGTDTRLRKVHGIQGPIDDAFLDSFVCVRPTGTPLSPAATAWASRTLDDFTREFAKYFRGDVRVIDDRDVTEGDISARNLILFGDPGSNSFLARIIGKLPLRWTSDTVSLGGKKFAAAESVPALIYPNPLNPSRYIVINSGHTFHEADLKGTNALLYPRLGDYAVIRASDGAVMTAGLFDDQWQLP